MSFVPAPGVVALNAIFTLDNQNCENTFNYRVSGTIDYAKLQAMANTYFAWALSVISAWPTNVQINKCYVRDLTTAGSVVGEFLPSSPLVGTAAGTTLPNNNTIAIKRETQHAGRTNRGRIYWVGIRREDLADANHMIPARATSFATNLNTLKSSQSSANSAVEVILHRGSGTTTDVTNYVCADFTVDSQRRRLPDHNRHH
jgi:hypothetical protein